MSRGISNIFVTLPSESSLPYTRVFLPALSAELHLTSQSTKICVSQSYYSVHQEESMEICKDPQLDSEGKRKRRETSNTEEGTIDLLKDIVFELCTRVTPHTAIIKK